MCFLGLQAVTLIMILIKHNAAGSTRLLKATRNFVFVSVGLGLFYYITYYRELVLGEFAAGPFLRGLDAIVFYALGYSWVKLVDAMIGSCNPKLTWWRKHVDKVFVILMGISAAAYIFLVNEYYTTDLLWAEVLIIALEIVLGVTVIIFTLAFVLIGCRELSDVSSKRYIILVSIMVNFNNLWNNTVVIAVFIKAVALSMWCTKLYGITSILLLITNLLTLLYVYKKDFSPTYFGKHKKEKKSLTEEEALNLVAEKSRLTERERDVMVLAYQGLTNPNIAEKLFISKHTVKRHMHNIFEKLNVSTRMELIHLIRIKADLE